MNDQRPPSSREPRPEPEQDPAKEVAKGAAIGCLAGAGAFGAFVLTAVLIFFALAAVGLFLLYLSCSGH